MFLDVTPWANGTAIRQTTAFVDCLAELPPDSWLAIGRAGIARRARGQYATASALLDATVADQRLHAEAWHLRDLVVSAAHYALAPAVRTPRKEREAMTAACALAERASLALLIRQSISREDFATLYAPFARAVPVDVLGVLPQGVDDNAAASPLSPPLTSRDSVRRGA